MGKKLADLQPLASSIWTALMALPPEGAEDAVSADQGVDVYLSPDGRHVLASVGDWFGRYDEVREAIVAAVGPAVRVSVEDEVARPSGYVTVRPPERGTTGARKPRDYKSQYRRRKYGRLHEFLASPPGVTLDPMSLARIRHQALPGPDSVRQWPLPPDEDRSRYLAWDQTEAHQFLDSLPCTQGLFCAVIAVEGAASRWWPAVEAAGHHTGRLQAVAAIVPAAQRALADGNLGAFSAEELEQMAHSAGALALAFNQSPAWYFVYALSNLADALRQLRERETGAAQGPTRRYAPPGYVARCDVNFGDAAAYALAATAGLTPGAYSLGQGMPPQYRAVLEAWWNECKARLAFWDASTAQITTVGRSAPGAAQKRGRKQDAVVSLFDRVARSVVGVEYKRYRRSGRPELDRLRRGTGVFIKHAGDEALILTSAHIVEEYQGLPGTESITVRVRQAKGTAVRAVEATVIASIPEWDLALLVLAPDLVPPVLPPGLPLDASPMPVGEAVHVVGFPRLGGGRAVSTSGGVVATRVLPTSTGRVGLDRPMRDVYLLDAQLGAGGSGAPVIDASGRVRAIYVSGLSQGGDDPVGFAIAVSVAPLVTLFQRAWRGWRGGSYLGAEFATRNPEALSQVVSVRRGSPAARAGVQRGDLIFGARLEGSEADWVDVFRLGQLLAWLEGVVPGTAVEVQLMRGPENDSQTVRVVTEPLPAVHRRSLVGRLVAWFRKRGPRTVAGSPGYRGQALAYQSGEHSVALRAQVPESPQLMQRGLLGRSLPPPPDGGMLLPNVNDIHMRGMKFPIDAVFFDTRGVVSSVQRALPGMASIRDPNAAHVLEMRAGAAAGLGIAPGGRLSRATVGAMRWPSQAQQQPQAVPVGLIEMGNMVVLFAATPQMQRALNEYGDLDPYLLGAIEWRYDSTAEVYRVAAVRARQGYGPFLYLLAMRAAGEEGLAPNASITQVSDAAKAVWARFAEAPIQWIRTAPLENGVHSQDYLNECYILQPVLSERVEEEHAVAADTAEQVLGADPYEEKWTQLIEAGDSWLRDEMERLYPRNR